MSDRPWLVSHKDAIKSQAEAGLAKRPPRPHNDKAIQDAMVGYEGSSASFKRHTATKPKEPPTQRIQPLRVGEDLSKYFLPPKDFLSANEIDATMTTLEIPVVNPETGAPLRAVVSPAGDVFQASAPAASLEPKVLTTEDKVHNLVGKLLGDFRESKIDNQKEKAMQEFGQGLRQLQEEHLDGHQVDGFLPEIRKTVKKSFWDTHVPKNSDEYRFLDNAYKGLRKAPPFHRAVAAAYVAEKDGISRVDLLKNSVKALKDRAAREEGISEKKFKEEKQFLQELKSLVGHPEINIKHIKV